MTEVQYRCECIAPVDTRRQHVDHALSLGYPDIVCGAETPETLHIYANGPSARDQTLHWPCMALNGAIGLFPLHRGPTYWAAVDPQETVADFVRAPRELTTYLVGSRCHPRVFGALAERPIQLWHVHDRDVEIADRDLIPEAPTITLMSLFLAAYLGYRRVVVHGWDGCAMNGQSHAIDQGHDAKFKRAEFNGHIYDTTDAWMAEIQEVPKVLDMLPFMDVTATGDGLIASMVRHIRSN